MRRLLIPLLAVLLALPLMTGVASAKTLEPQDFLWQVAPQAGPDDDD